MWRVLVCLLVEDASGEVDSCKLIPVSTGFPYTPTKILKLIEDNLDIILQHYVDAECAKDQVCPLLHIRRPRNAAV